MTPVRSTLRPECEALDDPSAEHFTTRVRSTLRPECGALYEPSAEHFTNRY